MTFPLPAWSVDIQLASLTLQSVAGALQLDVHSDGVRAIRRDDDIRLVTVQRAPDCSPGSYFAEGRKVLVSLLESKDLVAALEPALVEQVLELPRHFAIEAKYFSTVRTVLVLLGPCLDALSAEIRFALTAAHHVLNNIRADGALKLGCKFCRVSSYLIQSQSAGIGCFWAL